MNHKYSTYTLVGMMFVIVGGYGFSALDSSDLDEICNMDSALLVRITGEWMCTNTAMLEDDLRFAINTIATKGASNQPEWKTFIGNTQALAFDANTMEQGFVAFQLGHGRLDNSTLEHHFHWAPSTNNSGDVVICLEFSCANIDYTFDVPTTTGCVVDTANGTYKHQMTPYIEMVNVLQASSMCNTRVFRNASDVRDTYPDDMFLLEYDIHQYLYNIGDVH